MGSKSRDALASRLVAVLCFGAAGGPLYAAAANVDDGMAMPDYLALLARIAPAAHDAAVVYREAVRRRCGRDLRTPELRAAFSDGDGEPVLMAMVRASHLRDRSSLDRLASQVRCDGWRQP